MVRPRRRANPALRPGPPSAFFVPQIIRPLLAHTRLPVLICLQPHLGRNLSGLGHSRRRVNLKSRKGQVVCARWKQRKQKAIGRSCSGQIRISLEGRLPGPRVPQLTQWKKTCVFSQTTRTTILQISLVPGASRRRHQPSMLLLPNQSNHQRGPRIRPRIRQLHYLLPSRPSSRRACIELPRFRRPRLIFLLLLCLLRLAHPHHRMLARFRIMVAKPESLLLEPALLRPWCRA